MTKFKKTTLTALSVTMAAALAASQAMAFANAGDFRNGTVSNETVRTIGAKDLSGSLDLSDVSLKQLAENVVDTTTDSALKAAVPGGTATVIVNFDTPSLVQSKGDDMDVADYLATSSGKKALKNITDAQNSFFAKLSASGVSYKEVDRYNTVMSGVALEINASQISRLQKMANVSMIGVSKTYAALETPDAQVNPSNVYGTGIYDSSKITETYGVDGNGISVAVLDTGLDYTHPAFSHEPTQESITEEKVTKAFQSLQAVKRAPGISVNDLYLSKKVPFAFDYADDDADVYPSYSQHGVHVSGIIAGKDDYYINKDGDQVGEEDEKFDFLGVAPEAQIVVCKVFTDDLNDPDLGGATSEDIVAALDDCVKIGVDIINMSLGTTAGFTNLSIPGDEEGKMLNNVYTSVKNEGIALITAAGNEYSSGSGSEFGTNLASNPDSGTVGSPSTFVGSLSVASINGLPSPYMIANEGENSNYGSKPIYYNDSNDSNAVPFDFAQEMLGSAESGEFTYLVIPGIGSAGDYSSTVKNRLKPKSEGGLKEDGEKIIVVVRRGTSDFKTKVEIAHSMGADGIIVYNNVAGTIRMSLSDIEEENRIPSVSVNMDAGTLLTTDPNNPNRLRSEGKIKIDKTLQAGPFMNDYSSWGATPDLKLKPEITSHGGEITSTVSANGNSHGYEEMSGTSMATPNLAGLMALVRSYFKTHSEIYGNLSNKQDLTRLANQIVMSSATLVYDEEKLPYSPRKQGSGLATLDNIFTTRAYLYTGDDKICGEDNRPKIELGEDEQKKGEYTFTFMVKNFDSSSARTFKLISRFMTETISADGLAVAEAAYMLDDVPAEFSVSGATFADGKITLEANQTANITVTLKLSAAEKAYIDKNFVNGMYVEGFISLASETEGQCDLNLPFMGFYGDWQAAPLLDYNAYEIAEIEQDTSIRDDEKAHESTFATQLYSTYYNGKYAVPMGGFAYVQDENADQVYVSEEHCAISRFNVYHGATDNTNYLTSTGVRALYAGLLRNAELVTFDLYNADTGELIYQGKKYRVGKAYAGGGSARPALVDLRDDNIDSDNRPLYNNGKYEIDFNFYMKADDEGKAVSYKNQFNSTFYVDFDAPVLQSQRIRYYDYEENNKTKQRVYLDLDIYDNHYPQAVLLCYSEEPYDADSTEPAEINLATEYVTPIYKAGKNTTTTVSLDITDIYEKYKDRLYIQVDDYALNHSVYQIDFNADNVVNSDPEFDFVTNDRVRYENGSYRLSLNVNELYKVQLKNNGANLSNYNWESSNPDALVVKNGEVFARAETRRVELNVSSTNSVHKTLIIDITDTGRPFPVAVPTLTFGLVPGTNMNLEQAQGTVRVNAGQKFTMEIIPDPWYYPIDPHNFVWTSGNEDIATVDENGVVTTKNERGSAKITAALKENGMATNNAATVILRVAEPFDISNMTLNHYYGSETVVRIPDDENVMYIAEEAFEDNDTMEVLYIPKTVTQINERAFLNCTQLKEVYFIDKTDEPVKDLAAISLILADAFSGCTNLTTVDLTNVKVLTVGDTVFAGCKNLEEIVHMEKLGIAGAGAFMGCTALEEADISGLHTAGPAVFMGCTGLTSVKTAHYSALSSNMFNGCTNLTSVTINNPRVNEYAFYGCTNLGSVTFGGEGAWDNTVFRIEDRAFAGCSNLATVTFTGTGTKVSHIGDYAFAGTKITNFTMPDGDIEFGESIFDGTSANITWGSGYESNTAIYKGEVLVKAPATIDDSFTIKEETTEIGPYAFTDSKITAASKTIDISKITKLGEGAFAGSEIESITIPAGLTDIPAQAFRQSKLKNIAIPTTVKSIGEGAFAQCSDLAEVTFTSPETSELKSIGDGAFSSIKISAITLPDGCETMGNLVFYDCAELTTATLPSVKSLGTSTFEKCPNLTTVTFGENGDEVSSGTYTFFPGYQTQANGEWKVDEAGNVLFNESKLTTVNLGSKMKTLGEGVFYECNKLATIDLKNVTVLGMGAFANCSSLETVTGLSKVTSIGDSAFAGKVVYKLIDPDDPDLGVTVDRVETNKLTNLELTAAKYIGALAFINSAATQLSLPAVEVIGEQAFAGIQIASLSLPATLNSYGAGAFLAADKLKTVTVDGENQNYFAEGGVLYRNVKNSKTGGLNYELCLYPSGRDGNRYEVKDETASILARAFYSVSSLRQVVLPYSVKTIGAEAFLGCNITEYEFHSINAPTLLAEYSSNVLEQSAFRGMYYANFNSSVLSYWVGSIQGAQRSTTRIARPSNGVGYENFIYSLFFGEAKDLGEYMLDDTRELIKMIDGFPSVEEINGWANIDVNEQNTAMVKEFSDKLIEAHRIYLNIPTEKQMQFLNEGKDRASLLFSLETALRPIKTKFNIPFKVESISLSANSQHKSQYIEGEKFDLTGLVIDVHYDDYFVEEVSDISKITIDPLYAGELHTYNTQVTVLYEDKPLAIGITVSSADGQNAEEGSNCGNCSGCGTMGIGPTIGGIGLMLITLAGSLLLIQKSRRKANKN